ncbi:hypothetical protein ACFVZM_30015 [Streptomyces sioyaensis]|uniref:pyroglutamyl-peptidase I family protein n=1 Tax=Streptomyces sioyaensis TaxID=67364 RepID=UPI0036763659
MTGFGPFEGVPVNPTAEALHAIPDVQIAVLPVAYRTAGGLIGELLARNVPDVCLILGAATGISRLLLESRATNLDDSPFPDNTGEIRQGMAIIGGAPAHYASTLPLDSLEAALRAGGIPVTRSDHAGGYLCNHIFYLARYGLEASGRGSVPCGLLHVPLWPDPWVRHAVRLCTQVLSADASGPVRGRTAES